MNAEHLAELCMDELHGRMAEAHPPVGPMPVEVVIGCIRSAAPYMETIFRNGACWRFYLILKSVWPEAVPYITHLDGTHVITKIGDHFYDIGGKVKKPADAMQFNPATVLKERPHLWRCPLWHLANLEKLDPELLDWECADSRNKVVAPSAAA